MTTMIDPYLNKLTDLVCDQISDYLKDKKNEELITEHFSFRMKIKQFANFQEYYFKTVKNPDNLIFREFKQKYSLQGVDDNFIKKLQQNKPEIIKLISDDKLSELYFEHFAKAEIKHKDTFKEKNLGSFFTKIVHTFKPTDYTPLDIPIRNYFKLEGESYFVSFIVVSNAYKMWADKNKETIRNLKIYLENTGFDFLRHNSVTDMKLLNIIFWSVADNEKRKKADNTAI